MLCSTDENPLKITNIEKYQIIKALTVEYLIEKLCTILNISSRAYRLWKSKGCPIANNYNEQTASIIVDEHYSNFEVYGVERLKGSIKNKYNIVVNQKAIRRYKKILSLETIVRKKNPSSIKNTKPCNMNYMAQNLLKCNFISRNPYEKLSTDVSYIKCLNGTLYLSAVKDLFNNEIIAYKVSERNDVNLAMDTINTLPSLSAGCIIHSDQGELYYSWEYRNKLEEMNCIRSMSEKGKCWQNSPIENWFSQLKEEWLRRLGLMTKEETKKEIKKYVDWYNNRRIQKNLGNLSPIDFKSKYYF